VKRRAPSDDPGFLDRSASGPLLHLHVVPGASKTEIAGLHGDRLKVRVKAPPAEGAANRELLRFLGELLSAPASSLEIVRGASDRRKTVRLPAAVDLAALLRRSTTTTTTTPGGARARRE
jgi:uncharacterized protein (TIGR00251 family)